jgi:hypothetical protein
MNEIDTEDYRRRVLKILKTYSDTYGLKADLVNVNSRTIGRENYKVMKAILAEQNIGIEIDDRVTVGKFMFLNRELAVANML